MRENGGQKLTKFPRPITSNPPVTNLSLSSSPTNFPSITFNLSLFIEHLTFDTYIVWNRWNNVSRKTLLLARCNAISQRLMYLPGLVLLRTISPSLADYIANRLQPNRVQKPILGLRLNSSLPPFLPLVFWIFWAKRRWRSRQGCVTGRGRICVSVVSSRCGEGKDFPFFGVRIMFASSVVGIGGGRN